LKLDSFDSGLCAGQEARGSFGGERIMYYFFLACLVPFFSSYLNWQLLCVWREEARQRANTTARFKNSSGIPRKAGWCGTQANGRAVSKKTMPPPPGGAGRFAIPGVGSLTLSFDTSWGSKDFTTLNRTV
jgi:hypothetical protein